MLNVSNWHEIGKINILTPTHNNSPINLTRLRLHEPLRRSTISKIPKFQRPKVTIAKLSIKFYIQYQQIVTI